MDIWEWLQKLDLGQYAEAFAANDVTVDLLPSLTEDDLKELGVQSLGHRKKILAAIHEARGAGVTVPEIAPGDDASPDAPAGDRDDSERRQVTALFADVVSYTEFGRSHETEDIHRFLSRYFDIVDTIIGRHGGHVDKHIGDCVMAVFGAPVSHSNDAERAVRAAIEIHEALNELKKDFDRFGGVHIGIASGQVVASGLGSALHQEYTVTGDSVNLASRLTDEAKPGETLISGAVHRDLRNILRCARPRRLRVKGFADPVKAYPLIGMRSSPQRHAFVGRKSEIEQWRGIVKACTHSGYGGAVLVRGEAGIGKTALVEEFQRDARRRGFDCHTGLVLDFGTKTDQDAIASLVRSIIGVAADAGDDETSAALAGFAGSVGVAADDLPYINDILGLPQPAETRALYEAMDNATRVMGMRAAVANLINLASKAKPLVIVVEDVHWADHAMLDYLASISSVVTQGPALLVMTTRIEGDPLDKEWRSQIAGCPLLTIDVGPMRTQDARHFAEMYQETSDELTARCVERAAGNPLFLEQLLRHAQEQASQAIPGSIQSIVQARVDLLSAKNRDALQAAAVLGQRFTLDALRFLLDIPDYSCEDLISQFLVRPLGDVYLFNHALIRDSIYDAVLRTKRKRLHLAAAEWYEDDDLALKAEHLERAEDPGAAQAYLEASKAQARLYRYDRALTLARRGLTVGNDADIGFALTIAEGDILRELGNTAESIAAFERAKQIAETGPDSCRAAIGLVAGMRVADRFDEALALLDDAEALAREYDLDAELSEIHYYRGSLFFPRGNIEGCLAEHEAALEHAVRACVPEREALALSGLGDGYYAQGRMRTAHKVFLRCLELCGAHGFGRVEAANLFMLGTVRIYLNETEEALEDSLRSADVASRVGHKRAEIVSRLTAGWVLIAMSKLDEAREQVQLGLDLVAAIGAKRFEPFLQESLARVLLYEGQKPEAVEIIDNALGTARELKMMTFIGPWLLGTLALATDDADRREQSLEEGVELLASGCVGHNYYRFYQNAMEACFNAEDWAGVNRFAGELEAYTNAEPVPWSDFYIGRGRALAEYGAGQRSDTLQARLRELRDQAEAAQLSLTVPALEAALAGSKMKGGSMSAAR